LSVRCPTMLATVYLESVGREYPRMLSPPGIGPGGTVLQAYSTVPKA